MKCPIPEEALGKHAAILGKTGSGKTYAWKSVVEHLLQHGKHVAIVDPTSAWWGLRASRDGTRAGFQVIVLGGDHGDLPLPALGGAAVARLIVEQHANVIADTSGLTVGEQARWFIDFAGTLYRLNRSPLHLVLDEAHNFAPQGKVPDPDTGKMLHAAARIASGGRSRGIRLAMITQRPQKLHKDVLTSADTLVAMRVLAPQDREAVREWIRGCGDEAQGKEVLDSLAGLPRGEGWVWYPEGAYLRRQKFPPIGTFDSSATPEDGHQVEAPKGMAEIDLSAVREALEEAVREAEANDPRLLRRKVGELEARLAELGQLVHQVDVDAELDAAARSAREHERGLLREALNVGAKRIDQVLLELAQIVGEGEASVPPAPRQRSSFVPPPAPARTFERSRIVIHESNMPAGVTNLPRAERLILTALAQYPAGRSVTQVAILTGYAANGGGFRNAVSALRSAGRIEGGGDQLRITAAGMKALGPFEPLPTGSALLAHWMRQLSKAERKALEALAEVYPRTLSVPQVAARAGYEPDGGGFRNALSRLRTLELVRGRGEMRASEDLFG